ncbi:MULTISPECIES: hypothetical protein [unclassified Clostridium]|uniref:hypothetical protein n=1 Tax=unclassified Clostridium TaxID=2614128 RepID=UPI0025C2A192|nr:MULTISPECIES: hypothetical protein [unclassified Clostridium]
MANEINLQEAINLIDDKYRNFKDFIKHQNPIYCEIREDSNEIIFDEVDYYGRQYMIIIPYKIKNKNPKIIFRDDLTDLNRLWELYSVDTDVTKPKHDKLLSEIENLSCEFYSTGNGNDEYEWYDLSMDLLEFNEEILKKCTVLWTSYNEELNKLVDRSK